MARVDAEPGERWARCRAAFYDRLAARVRRCTLHRGHEGMHRYRRWDHAAAVDPQDAPEAPRSFTRG